MYDPLDDLPAGSMPNLERLEASVVAAAEQLTCDAVVQSRLDAAARAGLFDSPCGCRRLLVPDDEDGVPDYSRARVRHDCGA